jgi:hypothetical protein
MTATEMRALEWTMRVRHALLDMTDRPDVPEDDREQAWEHYKDITSAMHDYETWGDRDSYECMLFWAICGAEHLIGMH